MHPSSHSRFSSGYDSIDLVVTPTPDDVALLQTAFCEDIRYWSDGIEREMDGDRMYLRCPPEPGHIVAYPDDDVEYGELALPMDVIRSIGLRTVPVETEFLVARPSQAEQLDRFYV